MSPANYPQSSATRYKLPLIIPYLSPSEKHEPVFLTYIKKQIKEPCTPLPLACIYPGIVQVSRYNTGPNQCQCNGPATYSLSGKASNSFSYLVRPRSREMRGYNYRIWQAFWQHCCQGACHVFCDWKSLNPNLASSRPHGILWKEAHGHFLSH